MTRAANFSRRLWNYKGQSVYILKQDTLNLDKSLAQIMFGQLLHSQRGRSCTIVLCLLSKSNRNYRLLVAIGCVELFKAVINKCVFNYNRHLAK